MSLFDLFFIFLFLSSAAASATALVCAIRGRVATALRILRGIGICWGAYIGIVAITSLFLPRQMLHVGATNCFDDWCIAVDNVHRAAANGNISYTVGLRVSSRARRVSQRERNVVVYLTDDRGRRYDPIPQEADIPLSVMLRPQESVETKRVFEVPADAHVGLVIAHEGGFPIGWFIIGYETWFRKPAVLPLS